MSGVCVIINVRIGKKIIMNKEMMHILSLDMKGDPCNDDAMIVASQRNCYSAKKRCNFFF